MAATSGMANGELFSYVDLEQRVRADHPLRPIGGIVNEALSALERFNLQAWKLSPEDLVTPR